MLEVDVREAVSVDKEGYEGEEDEDGGEEVVALAHGLDLAADFGQFLL